ncbi:MAG: ATP-binding protein [Planctomycetota bacterium]|nr:ATP-binding protein [Planctomycetota bacterium]
MNEHTSDKRVPAPSHDTSEDVAPLIKRLSEFSSELARRDELIEQQMQEYRQTLDKTREVVNSIQDAFVLTDDNGEIVEANETFQKLSGYAPSEAEGKKLLTLLDDTSFSQQQSPASPPTLLLLCKNGDKLPVTMFEKNVTLGGDDYTISLIRDTSREVQLSRAVKEKTSELEAGAVRAHRQVERYKSAQRQLTEQLFEGVLRADEAGNILYGNASAADILNFPTSIELISVNIFDDISFVDVSDNGIRAFFDGGEASFPAKVKFDTLDKKKGSAMVKANWQKEGDKRIAQILIHDTSEYDKLRESITRLREEMDVVLREHENELLISQNKLVAHAHSSGMAHVASEVLHNIGNAVNSINVRLKNISESIEREKLPSRLRRVADLYSENGDGETEQTAAAGYMAALAEAVDKSRQQLIENVNFINEKLDHVSEIISLQQSVASVRGIIEKVNVKDLIVDAMEINREAITKRNIKVRFMFGEVPVIRVEKNKLIQVLVNIIKNAIEAIDSSDSERDEMVVSASYSKKTEMVSIDVKDSGIGMTAEVRANLFKFGFTTKEQGSGFGLHSSYNLIKAMGGTINAQSEGKGKGATFSIELPLMPPLREEAKKEVEWEIADGVTHLIAGRCRAFGSSK